MITMKHIYLLRRLECTFESFARNCYLSWFITLSSHDFGNVTCSHSSCVDIVNCNNAISSKNNIFQGTAGLHLVYNRPIFCRVNDNA
mmetsp:Transcript_11310/g.21168  ORF Transcript_11310/g.21168 Transcript_11310/m.21168 type:complete len:87 (-) Transcript_11310:2720-2980(-)